MAEDASPSGPVDAVGLRDRIASGAVSALAVAESYLATIAERDPAVGAFVWHDPGYVREQARRLDAHRGRGRPLGPLHGLPVALKDIIDTAGIPTCNGTEIDAGRVPERDAVIVARLRAAGAVIMGKSVTTELAYLHPGKTVNPHNPAHTPGGSSSGSAAAVASHMVPLAVGTQTGGSVIRPAAFCGVTGFKPSFGAIPRTGILAQSPSLDTVGVFGQTPGDAALICDVLFGHDAGDPATAPAPPPGLLQSAHSAPPLPPVFAFLRPPGWAEADPDTHAAFDELTAALGAQCFEVEVPKVFDMAAARRETINFAEMAKCYFRYDARGRAHLSAEIRDALDQGAAIGARDYLSALDWPGLLNAALDAIFQRCDAILVPATPGPAPEGLGSTGSAIFNGLWTLAGTPAVTIPVLTAGNGLPMGVQLVGPRQGDGRLLRSATWLHNWIRS